MNMSKEVLFVEGAKPPLPPGFAESRKKKSARRKAPKRSNPNSAASTPKKPKASSD